MLNASTPLLTLTPWWRSTLTFSQHARNESAGVGHATSVACHRRKNSGAMPPVMGARGTSRHNKFKAYGFEDQLKVLWCTYEAGIPTVQEDEDDGDADDADDDADEHEAVDTMT